MELGVLGDRSKLCRPNTILKASCAHHLPLHLTAHAADLFQDTSWTRPGADENVVAVVLQLMLGHVLWYMCELDELLCVLGPNHVTSEEHSLLNPEPMLASPWGLLRDHLVVDVYHVLNLGDLDDGI
jgi:hypothetical protein